MPEKETFFRELFRKFTHFFHALYDTTKWWHVEMCNTLWKQLLPENNESPSNKLLKSINKQLGLRGAIPIWGMPEYCMIIFAWERHHAFLATRSLHCALNCVRQLTIQDALTMFSGDDSDDDADSELILLPRQTCQIIKTTWIALLHVYSSKCDIIILIKMTPIVDQGEWKVRGPIKVGILSNIDSSDQIIATNPCSNNFRSM